MVRDITDQRLAAEEQARALSLHQATLRSMADGLLVVDPAGGVLSFNQRFIEMWQIPSVAAASGRARPLMRLAVTSDLGAVHNAGDAFSVVCGISG